MKRKLNFKLRQMIRKSLGFVLFLLADACLPEVWWTLPVKLVLVMLALYCLYEVLSYKRSNGNSTEKFK